MKTDAQLQQSVMAELKWTPSVHAAQIGVLARDGVVTLTGQVGSYSEKIDAEYAALHVSGVKALAVEMTVKRSAIGARTDADIARAVENVVEWTTFAPENAVKVMVEDGWVTLTGTVDWQSQRQAAHDAVRYLLGVAGVTNRIALNPMASASAVKGDIEAALRRRAPAGHVAVQVDGNHVTLSGHVASHAQRLQAVASAWAAPGVHHVVDDITLTP